MLAMAALVFVAVLLAGLWARELAGRPERQLELVFGTGGEDHASDDSRTGGRPLAGLEAEARRAGLPVSAVQFLGLSVIVALLGAGLAYTLLPRWYALLLGAAAGLFGPPWWVRRARRARAEAFSRALDGALGKVASYLRAGCSLEQAVQMAAGEVEEPVQSELQRAGRAISLGATAAEALAAVARRVESRDFELVVVSVGILTRTGGNLAEVLQKIAQQVQERRLTRQAVLAATTQVRMTAYVITAMPFAMTLLLRLLNPQYFAPMLESTAGQVVLIACYGAVVLAWAWIRRMLQVAAD